jgi:hypothetical protein
MNPDSPARCSPPALRWLCAATSVWVLALSAGFWALWSYASTPGALDQPPRSWPPVSALRRTSGRWNLVMFVHPRCPCTQASLSELERLQARTGGRVDLHVACLTPDGTAAEWSQSPLVVRARALPGTTVVSDADGQTARAFRATTSGEALLYDPAGRLAWHGGLTAARGHEGDNSGASAVLALLDGRPAPASGPAFGCSLFHHDQSPREAAP